MNRSSFLLPFFNKSQPEFLFCKGWRIVRTAKPLKRVISVHKSIDLLVYLNFISIFTHIYAINRQSMLSSLNDKQFLYNYHKGYSS